MTNPPPPAVYVSKIRREFLAVACCRVALSYILFFVGSCSFFLLMCYMQRPRLPCHPPGDFVHRSVWKHRARFWMFIHFHSPNVTLFFRTEAVRSNVRLGTRSRNRIVAGGQKERRTRLKKKTPGKNIYRLIYKDDSRRTPLSFYFLVPGYC